MKTSVCLVAICTVIFLGGCAQKPRLNEREAIAIARPFVKAWLGNDVEIRQGNRNAFFVPKERIWLVGFTSGAVEDVTLICIQDSTGKACLSTYQEGEAIKAPEGRDSDDSRFFLSLEEFRKALARQRIRHR